MYEYIAREITYAARFCAFRFVCAGVIDSFSSLLLRPKVGSAYLFSSPSIDDGSSLVFVCGSLLETEVLVKESGGECGGGTNDEEPSSRTEASKPGKY